jgi:hypothetical protein
VKGGRLLEVTDHLQKGPNDAICLKFRVNNKTFGWVEVALKVL